MKANIPVNKKYSFMPHLQGSTHYQKVGPHHGQLVVLVSGATLCMAVWEPLIGPLVDAGLQVLRYDLPGRGHTRTDGLGTDFEAHLDQLDRLLKGLGLVKPVYMIGLASGALVAAEYAARNPAGVSYICLIAPDSAATRFTFVERLLSTPFIGGLIFRFAARRILFARVPRYSLRADTQLFIRKLLKFSLCSPDFRNAVLATVRTFPLHDGDECYRRLAKTGIPICIVWGKEDQITPSNAGDVLGVMFGTESLHVLDKVGHLPFVEAPGHMAALFLKNCRNAH